MPILLPSPPAQAARPGRTGAGRRTAAFCTPPPTPGHRGCPRSPSRGTPRPSRSRRCWGQRAQGGRPPPHGTAGSGARAVLRGEEPRRARLGHSAESSRRWPAGLLPSTSHRFISVPCISFCSFMAVIAERKRRRKRPFCVAPGHPRRSVPKSALQDQEQHESLLTRCHRAPSAQRLRRRTTLCSAPAEHLRQQTKARGSPRGVP